MRRIAFVLYLLGCCPSDPSSAPCSLDACSVGVFDGCEIGDTIAPCCQDGEVVQACARPAGRLVHRGDCAAVCIDGECAVSPMGTLTCCTFGRPDDPCLESVP